MRKMTPKMERKESAETVLCGCALGCQAPALGHRSLTHRQGFSEHRPGGRAVWQLEHSSVARRKLASERLVTLLVSSSYVSGRIDIWTKA